MTTEPTVNWAVLAAVPDLPEEDEDEDVPASLTGYPDIDRMVAERDLGALGAFAYMDSTESQERKIAALTGALTIPDLPARYKWEENARRAVDPEKERARERKYAVDQERITMMNVELKRRRAKRDADDMEAALAAKDERPLHERLNLLDFATIGADTDEPPFIVPRLVPADSYVALYSPPGVGKSLLALEGGVAVATGGEFFGQRCRQAHVLYIDAENPRSAVRDRIESLGVSMDDELTKWLHYSHLAEWPDLNTPAGGAVLAAAVDALGARLVILDTTMRLVVGRENDSDTFNDLYKYAVMPLKARECALLRLDHSGKDLEKGMRGSSAKEGAEDLTYVMEPAGEDRVTLQRKKNRLNLDGTGHFPLLRLSDPLRHIIVGGDAIRESKIETAITILDLEGAPIGISRRDALVILKAYSPPWKGRTEVLNEALERRRFIYGAVE